MVEGSGGKYFSVSPPNTTICLLHHVYIYIYEWVGSHKKVTTDQGFQGKYTVLGKVMAWFFFKKFSKTLFFQKFLLLSKQRAIAAVLLVFKLK